MNVSIQDKIAIVNNRIFNLSELENKILTKYSNIRNSKEYKSFKEDFIDMTMSCDIYEQRAYVKNLMRDSIIDDFKAKMIKDNDGRKIAAINFLVGLDLYDIYNN